MTIKLTDVSRTVSHALRHEPWVYELELDEQGWVNIADLLAALRTERKAWRELTADDLRRMNDEASKQRFELDGDRIRALYGHSTADKLRRTPATPPALLFHGTSPETAALIRAGGLLPMQRQYVHLSVDRPTALEVGRRKSPTPVLLAIDAARAHAAGTAFYEGNNLVWLADRVGAEFIDEDAAGTDP